MQRKCLRTFPFLYFGRAKSRFARLSYAPLLTKNSGAFSYNRSHSSKSEVRAIYVFYADVFWLQNFLMDFIALTGVNYFLKRHKRWRRIALIAAIFAAVSLLLLLVLHNMSLYLLLVHFVCNTSMVLLCFGWEGKRPFLENWAVTYLGILLLGGVFQWLWESGLLPQNYMLTASLAAVVGYVACVYLMQRKDFANQIYVVYLKKGTRQREFHAYWDSGNQLRDPYTGQAISIVSARAAEVFVDRGQDAIRYVPYRALGTEQGLMEVFTVEELRIRDGRRERKVGPAAIGIANPGLLEQKEYDMILHASLL